MNFTEEYQARKEEIDGYVKQFTDTFVTYPERLHEAMAYGLLSGGKRLRPLLLLEAARLFGAKPDVAAINCALAVECIHTYSLIHDDLPCMDNDDLRRGKPTCHVQFGEADAVLAGDALLNLAYELLFSAVRLTNNDERYVRAGSAIAAAAGASGMVGGQVCDMQPLLSEADRAATHVDYVYTHKTGALIAAALKAGALIGGACEEDVRKAEEFGMLFGYCFQLTDDLLDKEEEDEQKPTYLRLHGEEQTRAVCKEKTVAALRILQEWENAEFLTELTAHFMDRKE